LSPSPVRSCASPSTRCTPETLLPRLADFGGIAFHTGLGIAAEQRLTTALGA
jgi:hypothetical protein